MRLACRIVIICAGLAAVSGCQDKKPVDHAEATARVEADRAEATARVEAALLINNLTQQDKALASACRDAAKAGAGDVVVKGIKQINDLTLRDHVAVDCALMLRNSGQGTAANEVAKLVLDRDKRDEVLIKLASGS